MSDNIPTWTTCKLPPCLARILAKTDDLLVSDTQLMAWTGWPRSKLTRVYKAATWRNVTVGDMDRFLWACGLSPNKQRRYLWLLKRAWSSKEGLRNMRHLRTAHQPWRAAMVEALVQMVERELEHEYGDPVRS